MNINTGENYLSTILIPSVGDVLDMVDFFEKQILSLRTRGLCTEEEKQLYREWHTESSLHTKINDHTRFFRIIRNSEGRVIAYFESKQHGDYRDTQVVQFVLVDEGYRRIGLSKILRNEFYNWCCTHGYQSTWTYVHKDNTESQAAHANLGEYGTKIGNKVLFVLSLK